MRRLLLWCAGSLGVLSTYGVGLHGGCGVLFTAVLLWLSYLDLRDGMLYDCITMPFAVLGLMVSGLDSISDALLGGTLCGVLFYCLYRKCECHGKSPEPVRQTDYKGSQG